MKSELKSKLPGLSFYVGCEETADALLDSIVGAVQEVLKEGSWAQVLAEYGKTGLDLEMSFQTFIMEYYHAPIKKAKHGYL